VPDESAGRSDHLSPAGAPAACHGGSYAQAGRDDRGRSCQHRRELNAAALLQWLRRPRRRTVLPPAVVDGAMAMLLTADFDAVGCAAAAAAAAAVAAAHGGAAA